MSQIKIEEWQIEWQRGDLPVLHDHAQGDYEDWPRRYFANPASDLLKFVYFFAAVKEHHKYQKPNDPNRICYTVYIQKKDLPIFRMYPDVTEAEEVQYGVYQYR